MVAAPTETSDIETLSVWQASERSICPRGPTEKKYAEEKKREEYGWWMPPFYWIILSLSLAALLPFRPASFWPYCSPYWNLLLLLLRLRLPSHAVAQVWFRQLSCRYCSQSPVYQGEFCWIRSTFSSWITGCRFLEGRRCYVTSSSVSVVKFLFFPDQRSTVKPPVKFILLEQTSKKELGWKQILGCSKRI